MTEICTRYESYKSCEDALLSKMVQIIHNSVNCYHKYNLPGKIGKICSIRYATRLPIIVTALAIQVNGERNLGSEKGYFWLKPEDLVIIEGELNMENANTRGRRFELMKGHKFCKVCDTSKDVTDIAICYADLKEGDIVVCNYDNGKLSVRTVVGVYDSDKKWEHLVECEVIGVVDTSAIDLVRDRHHKVKELTDKMRKRADAIHDKLYWKTLADMDEEIKSLYEEYIKYDSIV